MAGRVMRDGDHPDNIIVTFNRGHAAAQLVLDLIRILPPERWQWAASRMLDRDMLADDEWWTRLVNHRDRTLNRAPSGKLPSYSTRMTAAHQMQVAASTRHIIEHRDDPVLADLGLDVAGSFRPGDQSWRDDDPPEGGWTMAAAAQRTYELGEGRCELPDGFGHSPGCPVVITDETAWSFVVHHIYPREEARRNKIPFAVIDVPSNLMAAWNGFTRSPLGGCHHKIHHERTAARTWGVLAEKGAIPAGWERSSTNQVRNHSNA